MPWFLAWKCAGSSGKNEQKLRNATNWHPTPQVPPPAHHSLAALARDSSSAWWSLVSLPPGMCLESWSPSQGRRGGWDIAFLLFNPQVPNSSRLPFFVGNLWSVHNSQTDVKTCFILFSCLDSSVVFRYLRVKLRNVAMIPRLWVMVFFLPCLQAHTLSLPRGTFNLTPSAPPTPTYTHLQSPSVFLRSKFMCFSDSLLRHTHIDTPPLIWGAHPSCTVICL
jgi:hypothetical protein